MRFIDDEALAKVDLAPFSSAAKLYLEFGFFKFQPGSGFANVSVDTRIFQNKDV